MRYLKTKIALSVMLSATFAMNAMADDYYDTATVVSATPQSERVNSPRQECHTEIIRESVGNGSSPTGAIIGGVAGGLLGNTIGRGGGRVASAAIGAGVGAVVGDRMANSNTSGGVVERPIDRCVTVDNWQTVSRGYLVTYRYNGHDYTTVTNEMPGSTIRVRIGVNAADNVTYAPAVNQVTYYPSQPAAVVYRDPVRVYATPAPVVVYGGWGARYGNGGYHRDYDGWGHERMERHRW